MSAPTEVNPRTVTACAWCHRTVRWVATAGGVVIGINPAPDPEGDIRLDDAGRAIVLTGTDIREDGQLWSQHNPTCEKSPRKRALRVAAQRTAGIPKCLACGGRLDLAIAALGETTHPTCDPRRELR